MGVTKCVLIVSDCAAASTAVQCTPLLTSWHVPPSPACCVLQVTYASDLSGVTDPKLPQHSQQQAQTQTHRSSGDFLVPPVQLHGSAGAGGNLAALRAMAAPSDSDGSGDMDRLAPVPAAPVPAAPALRDTTDDRATAASKGADPQETEELELIRMEQLWIRVQELEVEYALLGECWILHAILTAVNSALGSCSAFIFISLRCVARVRSWFTRKHRGRGGRP